MQAIKFSLNMIAP